MNTREAAKFVRKLRIDNNSILVVKEGSIIAEQKIAIGNAIRKAGIQNVILLIADDVDDVKVFNKLEMNRLGWFRKEEITRLLTSRSAKTQEVKGEKIESS